MAHWHDALRRYRRTALEVGTLGKPSRVMFVLCSESYAASALVAGCEAAMVLQTLGGARNPEDSATRATFEYAIRHKGVRRVIVCGHDGCEAFKEHGGDSRRATQATVVSQCVALREDRRMGPLLREHRVSLYPIWFDDREGDVFRCNFENERVELLSDEAFAGLLELGG